MRSPVPTLVAVCLALAAPAAAGDDPAGPPGGLAAGSPQPLPDSVVLAHDAECDHKPLYGGILVPLGAHAAHVEVTFEPHTSLLTCYILDGEALALIRIKQPFFMIRISADFLDQDRVVLLAAKENDETGETEGDTSVFWGGNKKLIGATMFAGLIDQIAISGRTYGQVEFSYPR